MEMPKGNYLGSKMSQINGFWVPTDHLPNIDRVVNEFKPLPNDVILGSFPKTGTTWLKSLLFSVINRANPKLESLLANHNPHDLVPFLEVQVFAGTNHYNLSADNYNTRIFGTHIPYQLLGNVADSCRVVYVTRNPKDTLVSKWHFTNKMKPQIDYFGQWPLEDATERFCTGKLVYGPYYEHVLGYKMASDEKPDKVLFVTYEELMADTKTHVERMAEFLGCPFSEVDKDKGTVEEIVKNCSFDTLRNHKANKSEDLPSWCPAPYATFFRQGVVGDHRKYLDDSTIERIDALTRDKFHAAGFIYGI